MHRMCEREQDKRMRKVKQILRIFAKVRHLLGSKELNGEELRKGHHMAGEGGARRRNTLLPVDPLVVQVCGL